MIFYITFGSSMVQAALNTRFKIEPGLAHYDLSVGEDTSTQPLGFSNALPYGAAELSVSGSQIFLSARYLQTLEGDIEEKPFDQSTMGAGSRFGDFDHNQTRIKLGFMIVQKFSLYLGYEQSQSSLNYTFDFPNAGNSNSTLNPGDTFKLNALYEFSTSGPFFGMSYAFTPAKSPIYVLLNLDVSALKGKLTNTSNNAFINDVNSGGATNSDTVLSERSAVASRVGINLLYLFQSGSSIKANIEVQHKDFGFNSENMYFFGIEYGF